MNPGRLIQGFIRLDYSFLQALQGDYHAAVMLAYLVDQSNYHSRTKKQLDWFYCTVEDVAERLILGKTAQMRAIEVLSSLNIIKFKVTGVPARRWFFCDPDEVSIKIGEILEILQKAYSKPTSTLTLSQLERLDQANQKAYSKPTSTLTLSQLYNLDPMNLDQINLEEAILPNPNTPPAAGQRHLDLSGTPKSPTMVLPGTILRKCTEIAPDLFKGFREGTKQAGETLKLLQEIRDGKFLSSHRFDPNWIQGKATFLEDLPLGPHQYPLTEEALLGLLAASVKAYSASDPLDPTMYPTRGTKITLKEWILDNHRAEGSHSCFLRYLVCTPKSAYATQLTEMQITVSPEVGKEIQGIYDDYLERGKTPWNERLQCTFWANTLRLLQWYGSRRSELAAIDPPGGGWVGVATERGFIALVRAFYAEEFIDLWPDKLLYPSGYGWRQFQGWTMNRPAPIQLNPNAQSPAEAAAARERYNQRILFNRIQERAHAIRRAMLESEGVELSLESAIEIATKELTPEV